MSHVDVATLNATVVSIYEAVLVALVARAGGARDTLARQIRTVRQQVSKQPLDGAAFLLGGQPWENYAATTPEQVQDLLLRLEELLYPDRVADRVREDSRTAELIERIKSLRKPAARAQSTAADVPTSAPHGGRVGRPARSRYSLPVGDGDRGVVLLNVLGALACQQPMPTRVRNRDGRVESCDAQMPALTSPHQAQSWVSQVNETLCPAWGLMADRDAQIDALVNAAKTQDYVQSPSTTGPPPAAGIVKELEETEKTLRGLSVYAVSSLRDMCMAATALGLQLNEWKASRPSRRYRLALTGGLIVGAAVFVVGVVVPLLATNAPDWLTVVIPMYAFAIVAVSLVILGLFYVLEL